MRLLLAISLLAPTALGVPPDDLSKLSERQLLERIEDEKNKTPSAVFEELGKSKTRASITTLRKGYAILTGDPALKSASSAFRHFRGVEGLQATAIATLFDSTTEDYTSRRRNAAIGLALFGELADAEIRRALLRNEDATIHKLPDGTLFNMVFFSNKAYAWSDNLQVLNENSEEASERVHTEPLKLKTLTYEGFIQGFAVPSVDTIYLLTDGQTYGGVMPKSGDILREIERINSVRHIIIHCISVGTDSGFLKKLAKQNGGHYTRVD